MDYRFCCFGEYDDMQPPCLKRCIDRYSCISETEARKAQAQLRRLVDELEERRNEETDQAT